MARGFLFFETVLFDILTSLKSGDTHTGTTIKGYVTT